MLMNGNSTFTKALGTEPHHQIQFSVISRTRVGEVGGLPLSGDAVGVFYSHNRLMQRIEKKNALKYITAIIETQEDEWIKRLFFS